MLITALCIYIEDRAPIFYQQERVGKDGQTFMVLKFRSMRNDAEKGSEPQWASANDPRTTSVGRIIRKLRIDELPQILNVLKGEMSFVGPRPERPFFVKQLSEEIPYYNVRHSIKPGITGLAQVRYQYGASVEDAIQKLQYDLYYVKNNSLFLDMLILIDTLQVVLFGKGGRWSEGVAPVVIKVAILFPLFDKVSSFRAWLRVSVTEYFCFYQELESDVDKHRGIQLFLDRRGFSFPVRAFVDQLAWPSARDGADSCLFADYSLGGDVSLSGRMG